MLKNLIISIISISILSSCANFTPKSETSVVKSEGAKELVIPSNVSEHKKWALEAKRDVARESHTHEFQLIGSATIDNPHKHDKKTYFLYGAEHLSLSLIHI